jgi:putative spermidine/putrescine transport system permease protein
MASRATRIGLVVWTMLVVLFLWFPLVIIGLYAFNKSNIQTWPIPGLTLKWFGQAWADSEVRGALVLSIKAALGATAVALLLGGAL